MQQPQTASALAPLGGEDPSDAYSMKKLVEPDVDSVREDVATEDDGDEGPPVKRSRLVVACDHYYGFLVNLENQIWACIAKHESCLWYVDSRVAPTMVDVEDFQSIIALYPTTFLFQKNAAVFV